MSRHVQEQVDEGDVVKARVVDCVGDAEQVLIRAIHLR